MRLIIVDNETDVCDYAAKIVRKRINEFKPTKDRLAVHSRHRWQSIAELVCGSIVNMSIIAEELVCEKNTQSCLDASINCVFFLFFH